MVLRGREYRETCERAELREVPGAYGGGALLLPAADAHARLMLLLLEVLLGHPPEEVALAGVLDVRQQLRQVPVRGVRLELAAVVAALLAHGIPVAHDDEGCREVQAVVGAALQQHLVRPRVVVTGVCHAARCPVVQLIDDALQGQLALHAVQLLGPEAQARIALGVAVLLAVHHLEVRRGQGDARQARGQTRAEVAAVHHLPQRQGRARIDVVPDHAELLQHAVGVGVRLAVHLVVERLQLQRLLVDPRASALHAQRVVQLRVEGQQVQLHLLAVHHLPGIHHVLDELRVGGAGGVYAHHHLRLLRLVLVGAQALDELAVGVDGVHASLVCRLEGRRQLLVQPRGEGLSAGGVADDERRAVQASPLLGAGVEAVGAARHQRHHQAACHIHRRGVLRGLQPLADVLQQRIGREERGNLRAPERQALRHPFPVGEGRGSRPLAVVAACRQQHFPHHLRHALRRLLARAFDDAPDLLFRQSQPRHHP